MAFASCGYFHFYIETSTRHGNIHRRRKKPASVDVSMSCGCFHVALHSDHTVRPRLTRRRLWVGGCGSAVVGRRLWMQMHPQLHKTYVNYIYIYIYIYIFVLGKWATRYAYVNVYVNYMRMSLFMYMYIRAARQSTHSFYFSFYFSFFPR